MPTNLLDGQGRRLRCRIGRRPRPPQRRLRPPRPRQRRDRGHVPALPLGRLSRRRGSLLPDAPRRRPTPAARAARPRRRASQRRPDPGRRVRARRPAARPAADPACTSRGAHAGSRSRPAARCRPARQLRRRSEHAVHTLSGRHDDVRGDRLSRLLLRRDLLRRHDHRRRRLRLVHAALVERRLHGRSLGERGGGRRNRGRREPRRLPPRRLRLPAQRRAAAGPGSPRCPGGRRGSTARSPSRWSRTSSHTTSAPTMPAR